MSERLFKVLDAEGRSCHGGSGQWSLPHDGQPGEWMPAIEGELVPCQNGYHLCREQDLASWLHESIYEAEYRGGRVDADDKIVVREARLLRRCENWTERTARLFACDCAERVLPIFEKAYPDDNRPRKAIEVARLFAEGKATKEELTAASAARAAWAAAGAARAAWAAARDAGAAAGAAGAARDAACKWQTEHLMTMLGYRS